jgi:hypothetical protein
MKTGSVLAIILFVLVAIAHLIRLVLGAGVGCHPVVEGEQGLVRGRGSRSKDRSYRSDVGACFSRDLCVGGG